MSADATSVQSGTVVLPRPVVVGVLLVGVAFGLLYQALTTSDHPGLAVVWGSLALAAYAAGLLCLVGARYGSQLGLTAWKFGPWTLVWFGISFGLASITWSGPQSGTSAEIDISSVLRALWLVGIGITAWAAGYVVRLDRPFRGSARRAVDVLGRRFAPDVRSPATPWILYSIGLGARVLDTALTGRFGYLGDAPSAVSTATSYGQVVGLLTLCAPLGVCVAALQVYRERVAGGRATLAILFLAELGFGAAAGGKADFVIAMLAVIVPMSTARRKMPVGLSILSCLLFLVVVIPFNHAYRSVARSASGSLAPMEAIHGAPGILRQTLGAQNPVTVVPTSALYLLQRIREIDSPAIIIQRTGGQIPFSNPVRMIEAPLADAIPRAIWSSKPILVGGYKFSQEYYGIPSTLYTSSAITPIGDLYRYGGWIPVVIGMSLLGALARLLDEVLDVGTNPHATFLVLLLFPALVKAEDDWATLLAGLPAAAAIWVFCVALSFRRETRDIDIPVSAVVHSLYLNEAKR